MPIIYSTISNSQAYTVYHEVQKAADGKSHPPRRVKKAVVIAGGANVMTPESSKALFTPRGVATFVKDDDFKALQECDAFKRHLKAGYLSVDEKASNASQERADKVAKDMEQKDRSAPITEGAASVGNQE